MPRIVQAQCGYCHKRFSLKAEQLNRQVRCPHCKTIVKITQRTETAVEAAQALDGSAAPRDPGVGHRPAAMSSVGIQSKNAAIVWVVLLGFALIAVIVGLWAVFNRGGAALVPTGWGSARTGQHFARDTVVEESATAPGDSAQVPGAGKAGGAAAAPKVVEPIEIKVERLLRGFREESATYAVGRVTNNMAETIEVIKIVVDLMDKDEKPMGQATAVIRNIPPKYTVPLVAEWKHEPGRRATRWMLSSYETNPTGIPRELPALAADEPWPVRDPNSVTPTGTIKVKVTNNGAVPVRDLLITAILLDTKHEIRGAAREVITKEIKPAESQEVSIPWDHCAGTLVNSVEVWVQPSI
ncbi:MAG: hypothetical protein IMZ66_13440 [Planctomycetes bacterium]|nr:hypothetical protein [Planctomycetota bacterium]